MRRLWLDIGNTRLKYWLTVGGKVQAQGAELHLQSPAQHLRGLRQHLLQQLLQRLLPSLQPLQQTPQLLQPFPHNWLTFV